MAKPTKRRVEGGTSKRVTPKGGVEPDAALERQAAMDRPRKPGTGSGSKRVADDSRRYTPPSHYNEPSPWWVPTIMWTLIGGGGLAIILNYAEVLPGTSNGASGWYLLGGLFAILLGIMTATQYR